MRRYLHICISMFALFLSACSQDTPDNISDSADELKTLQVEISNELNKLNEEERSIQALFEETLENDEELLTLSDGSATVFNNIETRYNSLEIIEGFEGQIVNEVDFIKSYDGEEFSQEILEKTVYSTLLI